MNKFRLWLRQTNKNRSYYIFLTIEVVVISMELLFMIGKLQAVSATKELGNAIVSKNVYTFTEYHYYRDDKSAVDQYLDNYNITSLRTYGLTMKLNGKYISMLGYSEELFDVYSLKVKEGEWIQTDKKYAYIPVIAVGNKYQVGDCFETEEPSYEFQVVGTISPEQYVLIIQGGGTTGYATLEETFFKPSVDFIVPCDGNRLNSVQKDQVDSRTEFSARLLLFPDDAAEETFVSELSQYGYLTNAQKMSENFTASNKEFYIVNSIVILIFSIIVLAGVGGINNMMELKNEKRMAIYYMYGFSKLECMVYTYLCMILPLVFGEILFTFIYFYGLKDNYDSMLLNINGLTFLLEILYVFVLFHITMIPELLRLRKKDLFGLYRQKV